ncbi:MAG TPA: anti-sigma factor [Bradyrhizobium sp.]|uniref:anti-sigma factor n=1 Tax=Bradyrhizobium sp. TaxID=376 RepID=UPI002D7F7AE6|nr:anti-sigma factor [Bradyrhizobium sp.]HET7886547.1 anti-sigma factor [Bradyrhizobium sp.]
MAYSEDHIALAAEYALGTLDADERAQVETMMSVDPQFTAMVVAWEHKLGALNQMVGSVEPRAEVWEKIRAAIGHSERQTPLVSPQAEVQPMAHESEAARVIAEAADTLGAGISGADISAADRFRPVASVTDHASIENSNVIELAAHARRWRMIATATSAIAAALVVMIGVGVSMPDLLPDSMRPKARPQVAETKAPPSAPRLSAQYVAVLQKEGGGPAFILTVDDATKNFTVRKVGAAADPGSSFELWLISDKLGKPRSLGVIGAGDFTSRPVLASYDADVVKSATYAVTVEQAGGSTDGNPHSAPILTGKLIETVPPR